MLEAVLTRVAMIPHHSSTLAQSSSVGELLAMAFTSRAHRSNVEFHSHWLVKKSDSSV